MIPVPALPPIESCPLLQSMQPATLFIDSEIAGETPAQGGEGQSRDGSFVPTTIREG